MIQWFVREWRGSGVWNSDWCCGISRDCHWSQKVSIPWSILLWSMRRWWWAIIWLSYLIVTLVSWDGRTMQESICKYSPSYRYQVQAAPGICFGIFFSSNAYQWIPGHSDLPVETFTFETRYEYMYSLSYLYGSGHTRYKYKVRTIIIIVNFFHSLLIIKLVLVQIKQRRGYIVHWLWLCGVTHWIKVLRML